MYNAVEQVRADTLVTRAEGVALTRLAEYYGFARPAYIEEEDFRAALLHMLFTAQPSLPSMFGFLTRLFSKWSRHSTFDMTGVDSCTLSLSDADFRNQLGDSTTSLSAANLDNRFVLISGRAYFLSRASLAAGVITCDFAPVKTAYFDAAAFTAGTTYAVEVLPFTLEEHSCKFELNIDGSIFVVPATYLEENSTQDQPAQSPQYGYLYDFFSEIALERLGETPIYLSADFFEARFFNLLDRCLAAGVDLSAKNIRWANGSPMYSSFTRLLQSSSVSSTLDYTVTIDRS